MPLNATFNLKNMQTAGHIARQSIAVHIFFACVTLFTVVRLAAPPAVVRSSGASSSIPLVVRLSSQGGNSIDSYITKKMMNSFHFQGTFVEFGCADGVTNSNTWSLEQMGWNGVCIEANPIAYAQAKKVRKNVVHAIVGPPGKFTFVAMRGACAQLSGIKELFSDAYLKLYDECLKKGMIDSEFTVVSTPLEIILEMYGMPRVTYISADCEGCEFSFIQSFNFTRYDVQIFNYEDNSVARPHKTEIDAILSSHGFNLEVEMGDRLFSRKSVHFVE